jgi:hypothetical protein
MNSNIVGIDGKPVAGQPQAAQAGQPPAPFQPPVDPNTGQPVLNPNTGQPYTQEEFQKAQAEAAQTVDLGCKMLSRVFPDALIIIGPSGIIHASGEVFRLNKMCRMAADDLDRHGEMMFRKMGWGAHRPGGPAPAQAPGNPAQQMTPEDQKKFQEEVQTALRKQIAKQASPPAAEEPPAPTQNENG